MKNQRTILTLLRMGRGRPERFDWNAQAGNHLEAPAGADLDALLALAQCARRCVLFSSELHRSDLSITQAAWQALDEAARARTLAMEWELATGLDPAACVFGARPGRSGFVELVGAERELIERLRAAHPGLMLAHPESVNSESKDPRAWFAEARRQLEAGELLLLEPARRSWPLRQISAGIAALLLVYALGQFTRHQLMQRQVAARAELAAHEAAAQAWQATHAGARLQLEELNRLRALESQRTARPVEAAKLDSKAHLRALDSVARELPTALQLTALSSDERGLRLAGFSKDPAALEELREAVLKAVPDWQPISSSHEPLGTGRWRFELRFATTGAGS
jgi:Tfp pilus assembly protein PilN